VESSPPQARFFDGDSMSAVSGDLRHRVGQIGRLRLIAAGELLGLLSGSLAAAAGEASPAARAGYVSAADLQNREAWDFAA